MTYEKKRIMEYWNRDDVESMYDKYLLSAEIELITRHIEPNAKVLDAGCGEGEGTLLYSTIPGVVVHAVDCSESRLRKATERLKGRKNVTMKKVDFLEQYCLDNDYDFIVSQRFLINITEWRLQQRVLLDLMGHLRSGGRLILLEGSVQGADSLNEFRAAWGLDPIDVKWHNLFLDNHLLNEFMEKHDYTLIDHDGLGAYFLLTRGVRPILSSDLNWDCEFNRKAATKRMENLLAFGTKFSRLNLWVFQK